jgi:hypothetical protein
MVLPSPYIAIKTVSSGNILAEDPERALGDSLLGTVDVPVLQLRGLEPRNYTVLPEPGVCT